MRGASRNEPLAAWSANKIQVDSVKTNIRVKANGGRRPSAFARHLLSKFGGMSVSDAKRLKELETVNVRLKRLLADALFEKE